MNKRRWVELLVVPVLAGILGLAGVVTGALISASVENDRTDREIRRDVAELRIAAYSSYLDAYANYAIDVEVKISEAVRTRVPIERGRPLTEISDEARQYVRESFRVAIVITPEVNRKMRAADEALYQLHGWVDDYPPFNPGEASWDAEYERLGDELIKANRALTRAIAAEIRQLTRTGGSERD